MSKAWNIGERFPVHVIQFYPCIINEITIKHLCSIEFEVLAHQVFSSWQSICLSGPIEIPAGNSITRVAIFHSRSRDLCRAPMMRLNIPFSEEHRADSHLTFSSSWPCLPNMSILSTINRLSTLLIVSRSFPLSIFRYLFLPALCAGVGRDIGRNAARSIFSTRGCSRATKRERREVRLENWRS